MQDSNGKILRSNQWGDLLCTTEPVTASGYNPIIIWCPRFLSWYTTMILCERLGQGQAISYGFSMTIIIEREYIITTSWHNRQLKSIYQPQNIQLKNVSIILFSISQCSVIFSWWFSTSAIYQKQSFAISHISLYPTHMLLIFAPFSQFTKLTFGIDDSGSGPIHRRSSNHHHIVSQWYSDWVRQIPAERHDTDSVCRHPKLSSIHNETETFNDRHRSRSKDIFASFDITFLRNIGLHFLLGLYNKKGSSLLNAILIRAFCNGKWRCWKNKDGRRVQSWLLYIIIQRTKINAGESHNKWLTM